MVPTQMVGLERRVEKATLDVQAYPFVGALSTARKLGAVHAVHAHAANARAAAPRRAVRVPTVRTRRPRRPKRRPRKRAGSPP